MWVKRPGSVHRRQETAVFAVLMEVFMFAFGLMIEASRAFGTILGNLLNPMQS